MGKKVEKEREKEILFCHKVVFLLLFFSDSEEFEMEQQSEINLGEFLTEFFFL